MFKTFIDFFKNKDVRKRILFTLLVLFVYRLGSTIPAPGINATSIKLFDNTILGMMNILGGGSIEQMSVFSLGVGPYITASIIIELLAMDIIPALAEMAKSGNKGRQQMDRITRYLGVAMGLVQGYFIVRYLDKQYNMVYNPGFASYAYTAVIFTAGTMFLMWLADKITTKGIGQGTSMIIFAGIVANMPSNWKSVYTLFTSEEASALGIGGFIGYCVMYLVIIVLVVVMQLAERRIPIQQSTSRALNKTKGDLNHIPLKINSASVVPVIFASALIQGPQIIASWVNNDAYNWLVKVCDFTSPWFLCFYAVLIILFTFFYTNLTIDPQKMADDLGKNGQYIPGVRPGSETKNYVSKVLNRITVLGAILLTFIAILPYATTVILKSAFEIEMSQSLAVGGTGIIIVVGIAMDTVKQMKSMLTSKQYKSFVGK